MRKLSILIKSYIYCVGKHQQPIDWPTRLRVAIGSAKALAYLHEGCEFLQISFHLKIGIFNLRIILLDLMLYVQKHDFKYFIGRPRIIHRDIKSSNILLDDEFHPKVQNFLLLRYVLFFNHIYVHYISSVSKFVIWVKHLQTLNSIIQF